MTTVGDPLADLVDKVRRFLGPAPDEVYIVGGFARDWFLGKLSKDLDIVLRGDPVGIGQALAVAIGGDYYTLDNDRGIGRVVLRGTDQQEPLTIDLSPLANDIYEDLSQRDFTIDSMAIPLVAGRDWREAPIVDPFGGRRDLGAKLVRLTGDGGFIADPVRLLRAIRLAAELRGTIEKETRRSMCRYSGSLAGSPGERVRDELCRVLDLPEAAGWLYEMDDIGLLRCLFPPLEEGRGVQQPVEHVWDVLCHNLESVRAVEELLTPDSNIGPTVSLASWEEDLPNYFEQSVLGGRSRSVLLKLAALLHDVAKPRTRTFEPSGRMRFLGHAEQGAQIAAELLSNLRFSRYEQKAISTMIFYHLRPVQLSPPGLLPTDRAIYRYLRDLGDFGVDTLYLSLADHRAARGPSLCMMEWNFHRRQVSLVLERWLLDSRTEPVPRLINGHDLMAEFLLKPGPLIGYLLDIIQEACAIGEVTRRDQALDLASKVLSEDRSNWDCRKIDTVLN